MIPGGMGGGLNQDVAGDEGEWCSGSYGLNCVPQKDMLES